ncbi:penicillin-binding protein 2 [Moorena sp. SIO3H5]|uniref:peptidoglycan D,D-transpeptidase FtsI family protein n=1 Tax=Moorena sp. SIO3H5 TaxID=2607834 RepID=UPI0025EF75E7|nr:penicillin-binding protein 2 [Moorena sp. SIO3H5]
MKPGKSLGNNRLRLLMIWVIMMAGGSGLLLNLHRLQVSEGSSLEEKARRQQMVYMRPFVPRRPIVDRKGNVLAIDRPVYTLYAHPKLFKKSLQEIAALLAPMIKKTPTDLEEQFGKRKSGIRLGNTIPEAIADQIARLNLDGLELIRQYSRFYPQNELASDVVGYVNIFDHLGQAGLEYTQEKFLEREIKNIRLSRAGNGALMPGHVPEGFMHLDDLRLQITIDSRLQRAARSALKETIKKFNAERGSIIVMNVHNGSLLALVCEPTYNPNQYSKFDVSLFKNWALSDLYEPGSTFKPLNVAIALETGVITAQTLFNDTGKIQIGEWPILNHDYKSVGARGMINPTKILQHSSNVGMVRMMKKMKPEVYYDWLEKLGLKQKVGIELPAETAGQLKSKYKFKVSPIEPATASFGQGFSLTPIQLTQMVGALANGGKLVTPHVVRGLFDTKGNPHWQPRRPAPRRVFSPNTTRTVVEMMETVVTDGSGKASRIPGYRIGGKTGTAQKASPNGGYYSDAKITSFVGILPVESPRYVILAVVDEPQGNAFGSTVAAPLVKSVIEALIAIEQIPPSSQNFR